VKRLSVLRNETTKWLDRYSKLLDHYRKFNFSISPLYYNYGHQRWIGEQSCINEFERIDNLSDIKMYNIFISEWKNIRMFKERGYPTSYFFYRLSQLILTR